MLAVDGDGYRVDARCYGRGESLIKAGEHDPTVDDALHFLFADRSPHVIAAFRLDC